MFFSDYPIVFLFVVALICGLISTNSQAFYIKRRVEKESEFYLINAGLSLICGVVLLCLGGFKFKISVFSLVLSCTYGVLMMCYTVLYSRTIKTGPYGYTTVIVNLSTAVTALSGAIFWHEKLDVFKIIGIVLMIACFFFTIDIKNTSGRKVNLKWFVFSMICMMLVVIIGIIQKIHQTSEYSDELNSFLGISFFVGSALSFLIYLPMRRKESDGFRKRNVLPFILLIVIAGVSTAGNNVLNVFLAGKLDSAIFFPIASGVPLMGSLIVSFLFFKEKPQGKQIVGLILGVLSVVALII